MNTTDTAPLRVLVVGANSAIATAVARLYAAQNAKLFLVGRRTDAVEAAAADFRVRGAGEVASTTLDANDIASHSLVLDAAWSTWGGIDVALIAHGVLPDQQRAQLSVEETLASFDTNARSVVALLTDLANRFEAQGGGAIGVISSPAGDRGRGSNYVYGAAKASLTNFTSGLRHRLFNKGVRVVTILPGFVDTPMTATFRKGPLWASPDRVARDIVDALRRRNGTLYTPWFWRWIMLIVIHIPEGLFLRSEL